MSIETAFRDMCAAALSMSSPSNVYPLVLPQGYDGSYVVVTYQVITAPRDYVQEGADGVVTFRIQTNVWNGNYDDLLAARNTMAAAMSGAYGVTFDGLKIQGCFIDNEGDEVAGEIDEPGPRLFNKRIDWMVTAEQR